MTPAERQKQIDSMVAKLNRYPTLPLSVEGTVSLLEQYLAFRNHRLAALVLEAYQSVLDRLGRLPQSLIVPSAADEQTGTVGDLGIIPVSDEWSRTEYEMKQKVVVREDIDRALQKVGRMDPRPDNYIFVTTNWIDPAAQDYAKSLYAATGGVEFAVLDCIGFLRHFLHLFHRHRTAFLDTYQALVLAEPESAVSFELKQAFLALREAAMQAPAQGT